MSDRDSQDDVGTLDAYDPMDDIDRILRRQEERDADDEVERLLLINHWLETGMVTSSVITLPGYLLYSYSQNEHNPGTWKTLTRKPYC